MVNNFWRALACIPATDNSCPHQYCSDARHGTRSCLSAFLTKAAAVLCQGSVISKDRRPASAACVTSILAPSPLNEAADSGQSEPCEVVKMTLVAFAA